ncbi:MAG: hypothetical protein ACRCT8_10045 [Lacipirellulaceae bacterium]
MAASKQALTPLRRRLWAVAMTYAPRGWVFAMWAAALLAAIFVICVTLGAPGALSFGLRTLSAWLVASAVFLIGPLAGHAKSQFSTPAARLLPGYRGPHRGVLVALTVAMVLVYPCVALGVVGWPAAAALGVSVATAGVAAVISTRPVMAALPFIVAVLGGMSLAAFGPMQWFAPFDVKESSLHSMAAGLALGALGIGLIAQWLKDLSRLDEEHPAYGALPMDPTSLQSSRMARRLAANTVNQPYVTYMSGELDERAITPASPGEAVALKQLLRAAHPIRLRSALWGNAVSSAVVVWMMIGLVLANSPRDALDRMVFGSYLPLPLAVFVVLMSSTSCMSVLEELRRKRFQAATDVVRPFTRREYVRTMIAESARRALGMSVAGFAGGLAAVVVARPTSVMTDVPILLTMLPPLLAASFLGSMAAAWWVGRRLEGVMLYAFGLVNTIGVIAAVVGVASLYYNTGSLWPVLVATAVLALLGVLVWRAACRRWREVEFG